MKKPNTIMYAWGASADEVAAIKAVAPGAAQTLDNFGKRLNAFDEEVGLHQSEYNRLKQSLGGAVENLIAEAEADPDKNEQHEKAADALLRLMDHAGWIADRIARQPELDALNEKHNLEASLSRGTGPVFQDRDGRKIRALLPTEQLNANRPGEGIEPEAAGALVQAALLNDRGRLPASIRNALAGGSDGEGGYLLEPEVSRVFVDLARSASVCVRAGALTLPMTSPEMVFLKLVSDPTPSWRAELQAIDGTDLTFGRITLKPKMVAALVPVSMELLEDASNAASLITDVLRAVLGQALDNACLSGSGAENEPLGVVNHDGINTRGSIGTPTGYGDIVSGIGDVLGQNYPGEIGGLSLVENPAISTKYAGLADSTGQPLAAPSWVQEVQKYRTTSLAANASSEYTSTLGDFSQMVIGARTEGFRIDILPAGTVNVGSTSSINAATQFARIIRVWGRFDVALLRPSWFTAMSGITTA